MKQATGDAAWREAIVGPGLILAMLLTLVFF
jgi:hypothetical protein